MLPALSLPTCRTFITCAAGTLALVAAPRLDAQFTTGPAYEFPVMDMTGPAIVGSSMSSYLDSAGEPARTARRPARVTRPATLRFGRNAAISAALRREFTDRLLAGSPRDPATLARILEDNDWLALYRDGVARPNGLDERNLADAVTAYMIASWAIVHGQERIDPRGIQAARDAMRISMAASDQVARMTPTARQRMGESLVYGTMLIQGTRIEISRTRDAAMAQRMSRLYRDAVLSGFGVDLGTLDFTARGFTRRTSGS